MSKRSRAVPLLLVSATLAACNRSGSRHIYADLSTCRSEWGASCQISNQGCNDQIGTYYVFEGRRDQSSYRALCVERRGFGSSSSASHRYGHWRGG